MRGVALLAALFFVTHLFGSAGNITSLTGPTQITRNGKDKLKAEVSTPVEMNDTVETLESRTGITFSDETKVSVTEHSKLVIDTFVYDPDRKSTRLNSSHIPLSRMPSSA